MRRHGPVIVQCTESVVCPQNLWIKGTDVWKIQCEIWPALNANIKLILTITSGESLTSLGNVFVTPFISDLSMSETCLIASQVFASFLRSFLNVGKEWTRELLETPTREELDFADDVSRVGWTDALWPIVSSRLATLLSDVDCFSDNIGGMLKFKKTSNH